MGESTGAPCAGGYAFLAGRRAEGEEPTRRLNLTPFATPTLPGVGVQHDAGGLAEVMTDLKHLTPPAKDLRTASALRLDADAPPIARLAPKTAVARNPNFWECTHVDGQVLWEIDRRHISSHVGVLAEVHMRGSVRRATRQPL